MLTMNMIRPIFFFVLLLALYNSSLNGESITSSTSYPAFCQSAANDDLVFASFKRNVIYNQILEHVRFEEGIAYLNWIKKEVPEILDHIEKFRENDSLGEPVTYEYENYGKFSPTTLRYMKVAAELKKEFGDLLCSMHIVEIGGGYGGQCKILSDLCGFASYTLIDLPQCNALSRKYLNTLGVQNIHFLDNTDINQCGQYDLVISNYAFSEIDKMEQSNYLSEVIRDTPNGYMTLNFISDQFNLTSYTLNELISSLSSYGRKGKVVSECPKTHPNNFLLVWKEPPKDEKLSYAKVEPLRPSKSFQKRSAITYSFSGGRFGDNLITYFHAKWVSLNYGIPFLYKPFKNANLLQLSDEDPTIDNSYQFEKTMDLASYDEVASIDPSTLVTVPYFPECKWEYEAGLLPPNYIYFSTDWDEPRFHREIVRWLTPKKTINTLDLPDKKITVALHVRRGGKYEPFGPLSKVFPLKFPPDSFYIEQIQRVADIYKGQQLYIHLFTDDNNPKDIVKRFKKAINNTTVEISYKDPINIKDPTEKMMRDFYSLGKFDCLIHPMSNFSIVASLLGNYKLQIYPTHCYKQNGIYVIDGIDIKFNGNTGAQ